MGSYEPQNEVEDICRMSAYDNVEDRMPRPPLEESDQIFTEPWAEPWTHMGMETNTQVENANYFLNLGNFTTSNKFLNSKLG